MNVIIITSYLLITFEIFMVGVKTLHYQHRKKGLDKIKCEMISNMVLVKQLCKIAGYDVSKSVGYLTLQEDISSFLDEVNNITRYINTESKRIYKREMYEIYKRSRERHETLLLAYNSECSKINHILDKWPKPFNGTKPDYEEL